MRKRTGFFALFCMLVGAAALPWPGFSPDEKSVSTPSTVFAVETGTRSGVLPAQKPEGTPSYAAIAGILQESCASCHSGKRPAGGLHLDAYGPMMKGGKGGPVIVPGDPAKSELIRRVKGTSTPRMPKGGPPWLSPKETGLLEAWVLAGAPEGK